MNFTQAKLPNAYVIGHYQNRLVTEYYEKTYGSFESAYQESKQLNSGESEGEWHVLKFRNLSRISSWEVAEDLNGE